MSAVDYTPNEGTLADRVVQHLRAHPMDELEAVEIAAKFRCSVGSVSTLLASCITNQLIARRKGQMGAWLYIAGPRLFREQPKAPVHTASLPLAPAPAPVYPPETLHQRTPAPKAPAAKRAPLPMLDPSSIVVRHGVTDTGRTAPQRDAMWAALDKLDAPLSAIDVDKRYHGALARAARDYIKRPGHEAKRFAFRAHRDDSTLCTVLRTA